MTRLFEKMIVKYPTARDIIKNYTLIRAGSFTKEAIEQSFSLEVFRIAVDGTVYTNKGRAGSEPFSTTAGGIKAAKAVLEPK